MMTYAHNPSSAPNYAIYIKIPDLPDTIKREVRFLERLRTLLLEKAFDSMYTVPNLCKDLCMSASQLHRKLTGATGQSAVRIIQNLRLNKAKPLLSQDPSMPITEVAFACGFNDPDYFSRLFKKYTGMAPRQFRADTRAKQATM